MLRHRERILPWLTHRLGPVATPLYLGRRYRCAMCQTPLRRWAIFFTSAQGRPGRGRCPLCWSLSRTRQLWTWLLKSGELAFPRRVLHLAPEPSLVRALREHTLAEVTTADLERDDVDVCADLQRLPFTDERFDLVLCSHVLEHVPDDAAALAELYRVLEPGGAALIMVPLGRAPTEEDPSAPPAERERRFGQVDHVRRYGPDIVQRLEAAGFDVEVLAFPEALGMPEEALVRQGLDSADTLFVSRRP